MSKNSSDSLVDRPTVVVLLVLLLAVSITIPLIYVSGKQSGAASSFTSAKVDNISLEYVKNGCTQTLKSPELLMSLVDKEPFPYGLQSVIYRPSVIAKRVTLLFGFRHETRSWAIDLISMIDKTDGTDIFVDGDFESNYLTQSYEQCILSSTRSANGDLLFDLPFNGDFYYNDQTNAGMTYLFQSVDVIGGRYYNISFYLENRGYRSNSFVLIVGT